MMRRTCLCILALVLLASCDDPAPVTPPSSNKAPATIPATGSSAVFDLIEKSYGQYIDPEEPLGFSMKVRNLSAGAYRFWRGAKEPFYLWASDNAKDWLADQPAYLRIHGDLHPGNIGLYASKKADDTSRGKFGRHVAFGAVDFDDSANLPFQFELLQGAITFQLLAEQRRLKINDAELDDLLATMLAAYKAALESDKSPTDLLEDDRWVGKMLREARKREFVEELEKYIDKDHFLERVVDKQGRLKEVLRPAKGKGAMDEAIETALLNTPDGKDLFKDAEFKKKNIVEIVQRSQLEAAGSEGLKKFLVLIENKKSPEKVLILYLKQQIPSSAERVALIPKDTRTPGQRSADDMHIMCLPPSYFSSWCEMNGRSYRVSLKEPWTETMDAAEVDTFVDLKHMASIWGTVAGCAHRAQKKSPDIISRLTNELSSKLKERSLAFVKQVNADFESFMADQRTPAHIAKADTTLREMGLR